MADCQAVSEAGRHGGRLASWIVAFHDGFDQSGEDTDVYVRVILCKRHADAVRASGHRIREEN